MEQHRQYRRDSRAWVIKTEPRRAMNGRFLAEAPPDFLGVIEGGTCVCFDAKMTDKERFYFSEIKDHQAKDLEAVHLRGGIAFIALLYRGTPYVLRWSDLGRQYQAWRRGGAASLSAGEIEKMGRVMNGHDWLRVL